MKNQKSLREVQFISNVTSIRKFYAISRQKVSDLLGIDIKRYSSWEESRSFPNIDFCYSLSEIFKIDLHDLFNSTYKQIEEKYQITFNLTYREKIVHAPTNITETRVWIYLLYSSVSRNYKIGFSRNVDKRLKVLKIADPSLVAIYSFEGVPSNEKKLHIMFQKKRVGGEWFSLDQKDVELIKSYGQNVCLTTD